MFDLIKGNIRLWKAFWLLPVGVFILNGSLALLISASQNQNLIKQVFPYFVAWLLASVIFIWVSIWRCSKNTNWVGWGNLAKCVVLISFLSALLELFAFFNFVPAELAIFVNGISGWLSVGCAFLTVLYFFFFVVRGQLNKEGVIESEPEIIVKAKSAYIARNYREALVLFETAQEQMELDGLSQNYLRMCKKRIPTT